MSAPLEHTSAVPIRTAQITKDITTAHVIRDIMEMQRTVNRVSFAKFYFERYTLIIPLGFLGLTNDDYFIFFKKINTTKQ